MTKQFEVVQRGRPDLVRFITESELVAHEKMIQFQATDPKHEFLVAIKESRKLGEHRAFTGQTALVRVV